MSKTPGDWPAFPGRGEDPNSFHPGMTLRQWYAGEALKGIMSNPEKVKDCCEAVNEGRVDGILIWWDEVARVSFGLADAMLKYENKEERAAKHEKKTPEESR